MRLDMIKVLVALKQRNMTQKELAERCGYSRSIVNGICNGRSCLERTAKAIADALEMPVDELK